MIYYKRKYLINYLLPIFLICLSSLIVVSVITPYGSATTPDSLCYLDCASNIKKGNGIVYTDFSVLNVNKPSVIKSNWWPPMYPAALAFFSWHVPDVISASYLSSFLLFISATIVYFILYSFVRWYVALIAALSLCVTQCILTTYTYAWSETLFIPILLLSIWSAIHFIYYDHRNYKLKFIYLIIMTIFLISLMCTRYIGIIFYLLFFFVFYHVKNRKQFIPYFIVTNFAYGIAIWVFFLNNFAAEHLTFLVNAISHFGSSTNTGATHNNYLLVNIVDLFKSIREMLPLTLNIFLLIAFISVIIAIISWKQNQNYQTDDNYIRNISININIFVILLYIVSIIVLLTHNWGASDSGDSIEIRFLSVIFPSIWITLFLLFENQRKHNYFSLCLSILSIWIVISFTVKGFYSLSSIRENWKLSNNPGCSLGYVNNTYGNDTIPPDKNTFKQFISKITNNNSVLVTENPRHIQFLTGIKCVQLPSNFNSMVINELNNMPQKSYIVSPMDDNLRNCIVFCNANNLKVKGIHIDTIYVIKLPIFVN